MSDRDSSQAPAPRRTRHASSASTPGLAPAAVVSDSYEESLDTVIDWIDGGAPASEPARPPARPGKGTTA